MCGKSGMTLALLATVALSITACSDSEEPPQPPLDELPSLDEQPLPPAGQPSLGTPGQTPLNPLHAEIQEIQQRLGATQQKAMADSSIAQKYADLQQYLEDEMKSADPDFDAKQEKLQSLQADFSAAKQAGDQEKLETIVAEGTALQAELQQLREAMMEKEEVVARAEAFREALTARMTEIDPETPRLIERSTVIVAQLQGP
jgi:DNA repair exonuclease SbcCD ATPase subunit